MGVRVGFPYFSAEPTGRFSWGAALALTALLLLSAWSLWFWIGIVRQVPGDADTAEIEALVRPRVQPGDAIAVVPFWDLPGRGAFDGLPVRGVEDPALEDFPGASRLWVVHAFHRFDPAAFIARRGAALIEQHHAGHRHAALFTLPAWMTNAFSLRSRLAGARASTVHADERETDCGAFDGKKIVCGDPEWNYVGEVLRYVGHSDRRMIWAHPDGVERRIVFPDVPIGAEMVLSTALTAWGAALRPSREAPNTGTPISLTVYVGDEPVASVRHEPWGDYNRHRVRTELYRGKTLPVRVVVSSPDNGRRHFMFDLVIRPEPAP